VALQDGTELRVTAPPEPAIAPGTALWLHLPAEHCRALAK
jgi:iron(III) transport system ATP-binding protein